MKKTNLGILGGGQLGCMLCMAAKKLDVYTIVWSDDPVSYTHLTLPTNREV